MKYELCVVEEMEVREKQMARGEEDTKAEKRRFSSIYLEREREGVADISDPHFVIE